MEGYSEYDTTGGDNTEDQVFLLSYKEAFEDYFGSDEERLCMPTAYAVQNGAYTDDDIGRWCLRSPGNDQNNVINVDSEGLRDFYTADSDFVCIRPALWINLESDIF